MTRSSNESVGRRGIGRRRFLTGLGVGAAGALTLNKVEAHAEQVEGPVPNSTPDSRFSRMFQLPAFADPRSPAVRDAMIDIGKPGGLLDARDPLNQGPVRLITNPELSPRNLDQDVRNMTAGSTFIGQFLDHDVTFDNTSRLGVVAEPTQTPNSRIFTEGLSFHHLLRRYCLHGHHHLSGTRGSLHASADSRKGCGNGRADLP